MAVGSLKLFIQSLANRAGYQIRRLDRDVDLNDALSEHRRLLGPSVRTIFEVGAADGRDAAQYAAWYPEADVYAFEPVPESFESLMKFAGEHPRLHGFQCALSNSQGQARFNLGKVLFRLGDRAGSLGEMREVIRIAPKQPEGYLFLARGLLQESAPIDETHALVEKGLSLGANHYITKPFSGQDLMRKVRLCLDERRVAQAESPALG